MHAKLCLSEKVSKKIGCDLKVTYGDPQTIRGDARDSDKSVSGVGGIEAMSMMPTNRWREAAEYSEASIVGALGQIACGDSA